VQRLLAWIVTIALASPALAAPAGVPADDVDDTAVAPVVVPAPAPPPPPLVAPRSRAKLYAAGGLALTYGAFSTYAYFAWFRGKENHGMGFTFDGFGVDGYAGGADKLGHAWTGYLLSRATSGFLTTAGWPRFESSLVAASISQVFFTLSEYEDALIYQFEISDVIANVAGAAFAVLMVNVPEVDRLLDFRLEYVPSSDYRRTVRTSGNIDFFQDYSGQSYLLALHLDAIPRMPRVLGFADVVVGFESRHYSPARADPLDAPTQRLYLGVALNVQHLLGALFCDSPGRQIGHHVAEYVSVPYTTLKALDAQRSR